MSLNPRWTLAAAALMGFAGTALAANHVDAQNHEWLPLTVVTNFSWAQIDAVCQNELEAPGACNGSLGSLDLTDWTWASRAESVALIGEFMLAAGDTTDPAVIRGPNGYGTAAFNWAQSFTSAMGVTYPFLSPNGAQNEYTYGFTNGGGGDYSWLCRGQSCVWTSYAAASERYGGNSELWGAWFYRVAPVPEPASVALLLTGAGLLLGLQRRRSAGSGKRA